MARTNERKNGMSALQKILDKPYGTRTPLEQCISDAATLEDEHDGDYTLAEPRDDWTDRLTYPESTVGDASSPPDVGN